jgi:hypothetical protein
MKRVVLQKSRPQFRRAPVPTTRETNAAMRHLDEAVTDAGEIALRYGSFYGASNDALVEPVRERRFPIVGDGGGVSSFIHLDDAAATVLALEHPGPGIYNIVDDEPPRSATGCRSSRACSAPSRLVTSRGGSRGCSRATPP